MTRRLKIDLFGWTVIDVRVDDGTETSSVDPPKPELGPVTDRRSPPALGFASSRPRDLHRRPEIR